VILSQYLEVESSVISNKKLIELGSGTGLTGIAASIIGAEEITLTDLPDVLPFLKQNLVTNKVQDKIAVTALDWKTSSTHNTKYDIILGSDLIFSVNSIIPLIQTLHHLSHSETVILLAHKFRHEDVDDMLFQELENYFDECTPLLDPENAQNRIEIFRICFPKEIKE
jgi:predicted nicotinamide N-methyase